MVKLFRHTVFPLISPQRLFNFGAFRCGAYFKVRGINNINFKKPCQYLLPNENEKRNFTFNKAKNMQIFKYQHNFHCSFVYIPVRYAF